MCIKEEKKVFQNTTMAPDIHLLECLASLAALFQVTKGSKKTNEWCHWTGVNVMKMVQSEIPTSVLKDKRNDPQFD